MIYLNWFYTLRKITFILATIISLLVSAASFIFSKYIYKQKEFSIRKEIAIEQAKNLNSKIGALFSESTSFTLFHSQLLSSMVKSESLPEKSKFLKFYEILLQSSNNLKGISIIWNSGMYNVIDSFDNFSNIRDLAGRFAPYFQKQENGQIKISRVDEAENQNSWANSNLKDNQGLTVYNPYSKSEGIHKSEVIAIGASILVNNQNYGEVIFETSFSDVHKIISKENAPYNASIKIISEQGLVLASNDTTYKAGRNISLYPEENYFQKIISGYSKEMFYDEEKYIYLNLPVISNQNSLSWQLLFTFPKKELYSDKIAFYVWIFPISMFCLLNLFFYLIYKRLKWNFIKLKHTADTLSVNKTTSLEKVCELRELSAIQDSVVSIHERVSENIHRLQDIIAGNYQMIKNSKNSKDFLEQTICQLAENLQTSDEERKTRYKEDQIRNWVTQGFAKFSEIMRDSERNIKTQSQNIISHLVNYLNAVQGGVLIVNRESAGDAFIELIAFFAYDRDKLAKTRIELNEGLIGRAYQEQKTIYLTEIPEGYIYVTSGFGEKTPTNLLIVPMILDYNVIGILEITSFKSFEAYQIEFVEKLAEIFASSVHGIEIGQRTTSLLKESQDKGEKLSMQEEVLKQNLEEVRSMQEETAKLVSKLEKKEQLLNKSLFVIEIQAQGFLTDANKHACEIFEPSGISLKEMNIYDLFPDDFKRTVAFASFQLHVDKQSEYQCTLQMMNKSSDIVKARLFLIPGENRPYEENTVIIGGYLLNT